MKKQYVENKLLVRITVEKKKKLLVDLLSKRKKMFSRPCNHQRQLLDEKPQRVWCLIFLTRPSTSLAL